MGNASKSMSDMMTSPEYSSGRKLLLGIKSNSKQQILAAIETAKKERIIANSGGLDHEKQYDNMIYRMTAYLTGEYDVGEGVLFKKTPLAYARSLAADEAIECLETQIAAIKKMENTDKVSKTVGKVDSERVRQAKERLKEFQKEKNENK